MTDASVIPFVPNGNIHTTVAMIAAVAAKEIIAEGQASSSKRTPSK
jgi:choline dehydrogenase-like flavoprotein